ncbi:MAG: hypothetical protein ABSG68_13355 [Thermoguttaceae bacterium]|jgi:hypothetical protein
MRRLTTGRLGLPLLLFMVTHCSTPSVLGQQPDPGKKVVPDLVNPSGNASFDARALVEALANCNPPPELVEPPYHHPLFAKKYDWSEYRRVWDAIPALVRDAERAWPELVSHLDDRRYCTTATVFSGFTYNLTIGDVCHEIVEGNLAAAYHQELRPLTPLIEATMRPPIARDIKKLKAWCAERSKKRLYELQIEMCHWAISQLKAGTLANRVSPLRLRAWIASIEAEIESRQQSQWAVRYRCFVGEEWTPYSPERAEKEREAYISPKDPVPKR